MSKRSILFVCTGNICRSPTADGVMRALAEHGGHELVIDSAGTHAYHVGSKPDLRSMQAAKKRGYDLSGLRARKYRYEDFYEFDLILCMDRGHLEILQYERPDNASAEVALYLEYAGLGAKDVPDPYYGKNDGFEEVLDLIEQASKNILGKISGA